MSLIPYLPGISHSLASFAVPEEEHLRRREITFCAELMVKDGRWMIFQNRLSVGLGSEATHLPTTGFENLPKRRNLDFTERRTTSDAPLLTTSPLDNKVRNSSQPVLDEE